MSTPTIFQVNLDEIDQYYAYSNDFQVDSSLKESILETHPQMINEIFAEIKNFNAVQFRSQLNKVVLDSIPFPYKTEATRSRQSEIMSWLNDNPAFKTMNLSLFRQRVANHFLLRVHTMIFNEQEPLEHLIEKNVNIIKDIKKNI